MNQITFTSFRANNACVYRNVLCLTQHFFSCIGVAVFNVHRLRLLRELKHRGTIAEVAKALAYSPSAVSHQLALLETEVKTDLLQPVGRRVRLTPAAELLVSHTEILLRQLEQAQGDLEATLGEVEGTLKVACFQTAALSLIPGALRRLREIHPRLRIDVSELPPEESLPALIAYDFDMIIDEEYPGFPRTRSSEIEKIELVKDPIVLAFPDADAHRNFESVAGLKDVTWVMEPEWSAARQWTTAICREAGFEPDIQFESSDLLVHARLVNEGHAHAFLPSLALREGANNILIHPLPKHSDRSIFTATRHGSGTRPSIVAFREALAEEL